MDELTLKTLCLGPLANNCYLIFDRQSKKGFVIDNPKPCEELDNFIRKNDLDILFIALTHVHFDHIEGLDSNPFPFYVHKDDAPFLKDSRMNGSVFFNSAISISKKPRIYNQNGILRFCKYEIQILHTPGHSPGSVSLRLGKWLFSGDALFFNSIGRTDIPFASEEVLVRSIKEKILTLPDDTIVYPGHGPSTTVRQEKDNNPFLA
ncbi:MAG: MBL fold metallo-hydrolase [Omnitrophica bacterium]|nr:MBL fold metallo-hydrolase [Candidatus Omnitrophota bacterium]